MPIILLPRLDLANHLDVEVVADAIVHIAPAVRLDEDTLPRRFGGAVLGALFDEVVPLLRERLQVLGVVLLDLGALGDECYKVRAQLIAVFDALGGALVVAWLPEGVARRYQHVIVAVM